MDFQKTKNVETNSFSSGMNKDLDPQLIKDGVYSHAINSVLNSQNGNFPNLQNEEGTSLCISLPYTYNGSILLKDNRFAIFSTDNNSSEIGIFDNSNCTYKKLVNSKCLDFNTNYIVRGVSKQNGDCTESIYWCNNYNNNRILNIDNIPYTYTFADDDCKTKEYTTELDCNELELNSLIKIPCITINKSTTTGAIQNGAYQAVITYAIKEQTITDFYGVTTPVSIFTHENLGGSLDIELSNLDTDFPEYNLHIIATVVQQTTVYKVGTYSTTQNKVTITQIRPTDTTIPLSDVYLQKIVNSKAEDVVVSNNQLIWISPTTKPELDYQKLANEIKANWVAYAVPLEDKNHDIQSYLRDEIYALSIGWNYTDSSKTYKYPLIGREATAKEVEIINTEDAFELFLDNCDKKTSLKRWEVYNTASGNVETTPLDKCEYKIIGSGEFGYYESLEKYPDNTYTYGDLSCTPIRLFRFPDDSLVPRTLKDADGNVTHIIHLGVSLSNIEHPVDENGKKLNSIQNFEIYRADRTTEKSILGKGLLFNMGRYDAKDGTKMLYPNYPYNDLKTDKFLSKTQTKGAIFKEKNYTAFGDFSDKDYTFHSPSFSFSKPSFGNELKIEGIESGNVVGKYEKVYKHPRNKLLTDVAFLSSMLLGLGEAYLATREKTILTTIIENNDPILANTTVPAVGGAFAVAIVAYDKSVEAAKIATNWDPTGAALAAALIPIKNTFLGTMTAAAATGAAKVITSETVESTALNSIPPIIKSLNGIFLFSHYFQQGTQTGLDAIRSFSKHEQYAYQVNSYCKYNEFKPSLNGKKRRYIEDISYLYPTVQQFGNTTINNFRRESSVVLRLSKSLSFPTIKDNSRQTISQADACDSKEYSAKASSYYASIKQSRPSQYGQIQNIKWLNTGYCGAILTNESKYSVDLILGGDTFINRFSVKRKMHYFNQTAFGENDGFEFDYRKYINIPYPRYWMDSEEYDLSELVSITPKVPDDKCSLDCKKATSLIDKLKTSMVLRDQYFYLSNNGIIDFYVESEINLANRDWEEQSFYRHYDENKYSDVSSLLRADNLEYDNRYLYDKSYSKELTESVGFTQNIYFDPNKATTCYTKYNNRVFWSLPNNKDLLKDNWRTYLANNYYEFPLDNGNLTGVKVLDRTNIVFLFDKSGPYMHQAIDQLTTNAGIKVTIGDGGLFDRQPQPIVTTDVNYGSSNSRFAHTTSPYGVLYPSATNGRVFLLQGTNLNEISREGMQFWFQNNMDFNILKTHPNYLHKDNTIAGIGYQTAYDNTNEVYYLTKIDYKVKDEYKNSVFYDEDKDYFYLKVGNGKRVIEFKEPLYFEDCSWTISYMPKMKCWVSFHDWHPNSIIQTEKHFIGITNPTTTRKCSLWKHNERCDKYCNYYDTQYSWDIEYIINNGQNTSVLSNIEYILESYVYDANCISSHHLLDYNFNRAYISNTEQQSGLLKLNIATKNKISMVLQYPKINSDSIDIEYHKEEQKFRFNQFYNIAKNRAEFNSNYISTHIYNANGYRYVPNPDYINYAKPPFERTRFRHNWHKVYLSRENKNDESMPHMILKFVNNKTLLSPR